MIDDQIRRYEFTADTPHPPRSWGLGSVLSDAGGSTGQTASSKNWAEISVLLTEQPRRLHPATSGEPDCGTPLNPLGQLLLDFVNTDADARGWMFLFPDESEWESPDCDVMSARFLDFARAHGFTGYLIRADSEAEGQHWFAVVREPGSDLEYAVDWTARQFYNVPIPSIDHALIPCPLVFDWQGTYPLDVIEFETMVQANRNA